MKLKQVYFIRVLLICWLAFAFYCVRLFALDLVNNVENQNMKKEKRSKDEECELWESLIDFMSVNISYTMKRLLPADLKSLYTHERLSNSEAFSINPFASDYAVNENDEKGGINVAENVVYGW